MSPHFQFNMSLHDKSVGKDQFMSILRPIFAAWENCLSFDRIISSGLNLLLTQIYDYSEMKDGSAVFSSNSRNSIREDEKSEPILQLQCSCWINWILQKIQMKKIEQHLIAKALTHYFSWDEMKVLSHWLSEDHLQCRSVEIESWDSSVCNCWGGWQRKKLCYWDHSINLTSKWSVRNDYQVFEFSS